MRQANPADVKSLIAWGEMSLHKNNRANTYFELASCIIVGGLFDGETDHLSNFDEMHFIAIVRNLLLAGIRFSQNPDIRICNREYDNDFIKDTPTADSLFFHWVNKGVFNESPLLDLGHTWKAAITTSNSPIIGFRTNNSDCVGIEDLPDAYVPTNHNYEDEDTFIYHHHDTQLSM